MYDAEKAVILIKLNKIQQIIEDRIYIVNDEIENQKKLIKSIKIQLELITIEVVKNEEDLNNIKKKVDDIHVELEGIENQIKDYKKEIGDNIEEIQRLQQKIQEIMPKDNFWENLDRIINPISTAIKDLIKLLSNDIAGCQARIIMLENEIYQKQDKINYLYQQKDNCDNICVEIDRSIIILNNRRLELEHIQKELGIEKTKNENFKLELESLKSQSILIIDKIKQGIDLLDIGINLIDEIEEKSKILFSSNGLNFI
ncbi:hypothetical protein ACTFIU_009458 [Dictyostelium citrinum]